MHDSPLNPSEHVERIREILVGRQLQKVEDRIADLEAGLASRGARAADDVAESIREVRTSILEETEGLRHEIQRENKLRNEQYDQLSRQLDRASQSIQTTTAGLQARDSHLERHLSTQLEGLSAAMAARIDARVREILHHLQSEIVHWRNQIDRDMQTIREGSVTRTELKGRLARLASAAMEDDPEPEEGFLL